MNDLYENFAYDYDEFGAIEDYLGYDIIIGPVANDRVFPTIQALIIGQFTIEAALAALKPYKLFNQYCFTTEKALSALQFITSVTIEEGAK